MPVENYVRNFGDFEETYNWVECKSKSFLGKTYFFNLRTSCSTWVRPVSRHIHLPRFHQRIKTGNDLTHDLQDQMIMTSEEEDCIGIQSYTSSCTKKNARNIMDKYKKTLALLDYSAKLETQTNGEVPCLNQHFRDFSKFTCNTKQIPYSANSCSLRSDNSKYSSIEDKNNYDTRSTSQSVTSTGLYQTDSFHLKCTTNKRDDEHKVPEMYSVPRLRNIERCDLLTTMPRKRRAATTRKQKTSVQKTETKKPQIRPIICEMYGTKTINYNLVVPELPPGVKMTNLSDTSVTSSMCYVEKRQTNSTDYFSLRDLSFKIKEPSLSESTTTRTIGTSCTSCTSCTGSSSSDTR